MLYFVAFCVLCCILFCVVWWGFGGALSGFVWFRLVLFVFVCLFRFRVLRKSRQSFTKPSGYNLEKGVSEGVSERERESE